ncbi:di-heme oxidoredictase family protein [Hymenobacter radiodurans]|uniref:di-heme oxidoredictase family protein n=1 Tax=Hymenobacter radiodurans TaxID=2496028 RepID=UPI001F0F6BC9|nr:di-heme oxidoredictase family protein [Hymenobacter radiodurans]
MAGPSPRAAVFLRNPDDRPPPEDSLLDGPVAGLTTEQSGQFLRGDVAFNDEVFTSANGLGPLFVSNSCGSCHAGDGKGHPATTLTRFGQVDSTGNPFAGRQGPQLQHRALPGLMPEVLPAGVVHSRFTPRLTPAWASSTPCPTTPCWPWPIPTTATATASAAGPTG